MSDGAIAATGSDNRPVASAPAAGDELSFAAPLEGNPDHAFCAAVRLLLLTMICIG